MLCIFFFPVGLYALWKSDIISKGWKIGVTIIIVLVVISIYGNKDKNKVASSDSSAQNSSTETEKTPQIGVGQVLKTNYFDITVNKAELNTKLNTGNQFIDKEAEQGNEFLKINASFKNTDTESRMLSEGSVWINYNGKDYEFDKSETVMLEGWGLLLDQINPLTTKTTNLVYKIPNEIKGPAYWQPGRASSEEKIFPGN